MKCIFGIYLFVLRTFVNSTTEEKWSLLYWKSFWDNQSMSLQIVMSWLSKHNNILHTSSAADASRIACSKKLIFVAPGMVS